MKFGLDIANFDYDLPKELIAQEPLEERDQSRLLVVSRENGDLKHDRFFNLPAYLRSGDTLIFNNTKVIPARLIGRRTDTGGKVEVLLLTRVEDGCWEVLVKPGRRAPQGVSLQFGSNLEGRIVERTEYGGRIMQFLCNGEFEEALAQVGEVPLPPYIKKQLDQRERYQTVYACQEGSVAAPTAGLHFTPALIEKIKEKGVATGFVTLHVGIGTFRPVTESDITRHRMHREFFVLPPETAALLNRTRAQGGRIVAVGTTTVRTLETVADAGPIRPQSGWTEIFIFPGHRFKLVDALVTNFHLPRSTLLMLVSAFAGRELILKAYREAVLERYRFFSFGDAMLIV